MKKHYYLLTAVIVGIISCKPQTETRVHMDTTGNRMSDSIQRYVDSCLGLPAHELAGTGSPIASAASSFTPVAQPK